MSDNVQSSADRLAQVLAAYQERMVDHESPSVDTSGLNADELDQFHRLRDCLVQLEQLRFVEQSIEAMKEGRPPEATAPHDEQRPITGRGRIGRFEILRELGRGGLGVVFLAQDELLNRLVALKVPRPEVLVTPDVRERFDREAQAAARLTHPNLVPVHEVGQVGPIIYIVSAYCAGPNLRQWLDERGGPVPPHRAARLIAPLADAVHYAHCHGVLHRDIKPSNVLLEPAQSEADLVASDEDGSELPFAPKLVDFGLAKVTDAPGAHTRSGVAMGTFGYMAPEQAEGRLREVGPATDVHALGAVLYECLTGRPPYLGESEADCLRRIVSDEPPRPSRRGHQLPHDLEAICLKCLEKLPARRYASAGDLAADLRRFLAGEPTKARPLGPIDRAWRWTRRRPAAAALLAVSLLAGVTIVAGSMFYTARLDRALATSEQRRVEANAMRDEAEANARIARDNEARVRQHVYVADMRVAQQLRQDGDLASIAGLLDRYLPKTEDSLVSSAANLSATAATQDARGFEWQYLNRFRNVIRVKIQAHADEIDLLAFSEQGNVLATAGIQDGKLCLWEIPSGRALGSFPVRTKPPRRGEEAVAALSADGRRVAALVDPQTVMVWDVASHEELVRLHHEHTVLTIAFSPDGCQIAAGDEQTTILWSCVTGKQVSTHPAARLLAFAPDGRQLAVVAPRAVANTVHLCDLPSSPVEPDLAFPESVRHVSYSPNGTKMACVLESLLRGGVWIYDRRTGAMGGMPPLREERYHRGGFSGDSRWLVGSSADGSLTMWDSRAGHPLGVLRGPATRLVRFAFSGDNRWLATSTPDGAVLLWEKRLLDPCDALVPENEVVGPLAFSADGKTLAACTIEGGVLLMDVVSGKVDVRLANHHDRIRDLAFSPDGTRLVTTEGETIRCWNRHDGTQQWSTDGNRANCVRWSPEVGMIASSGYDKLIHLYDASDGAEKGNWWGYSEITGLGFLPNQPLLVSAGADGMVRFWDFAKGIRLMSEDVESSARRRDLATGDPQVTSFPAGAAIDQIALSADGAAMAVGYRTGGLRVWPLGDVLEPAEPKFSCFWAGTCPSALTFSPDGHTLGVGGGLGTFRAFDVNTQQALYTLSGRRVGATSVAYGPDGRTLATVSREGSLSLWDVSHWQTRTLAGSPLLPVRSLDFSADGTRLAIGTDDALPPDRAATEVSTTPNVRQFISPRSAVGRFSGRPINLDGAPWDASGPGFRVWDLANGREQEPLGKSMTLTAIPLVAWSCQGIVAAGSRDGTVWIWNTHNSQLVTRFAVNPTSRDVMSWKPEAARPLVTHGALTRLDSVAALAFSPDGAELAVATKSGLVQVVDAKNWEARTTLCSDAAQVACLAFAPSGLALVTNRRGQLICWNLSDLEKRDGPGTSGQVSDPDLCAAAFSHDGRTLAVGRQDGTVQLVDAESLNHRDAAVADDLPRRTLKGHLDRAVSMSFSRDDRTLATGSWDATVRLWHVASGQEVAVLKAHHGKVEAVAFSPDGTVLATGGQRDADHGEAFLWRTTPSPSSELGSGAGSSFRPTRRP